jgi:septal ring factor EnvC (AmiA/AmiB activator)
MRNAYERAVVAAGAAVPELVPSADEPDWIAGLEQLRAVLTEAPHRPVASERARNEKAAAEREVQHRELVRWHVKEVMRAGTAAMRRVPDRLRDEVERDAAAERARREARARELSEQAVAERAARSGQSQDRVPGQVIPAEPFLRVG